jgi:tRNA(Ile)-lysidine synthase
MKEQFAQHIKDNFPFLENEPFFIAVSGGIDSMVLVHLCAQLQLNFEVLHCNFQLRGAESDADLQFVASYCQQQAITIHTQAFDTAALAAQNKESIQVTARNLRYQWFYEKMAATNCKYLLTAHHLDDSLETVLINFSRGTGLEGLTGIPAQNGNVIRPLLPFSRKEIEHFAEKNQIQWREDASNASDKYLRNKIRHSIVPVFKEINEGFLDSFQNTLHHLQQAESLLDDATKLVFEKVVTEKEDQLEINLAQLLKFQNYKAYLYQWLVPYGFSAWNDIYDLVEAQSGKQVFSTTHVLLKDREKLILSERQEGNEEVIFIIESKESKVNIPLNISFCNVSNQLESDSNCIFVDEDKIAFPLILRKWREGDYFYPSGMTGKKKLSKYFKDEKYSMLDKENQWLLCTDDQIIWVIGKRADQRFLAQKVTVKTIQIVLK